jgi:hypothetical protein
MNYVTLNLNVDGQAPQRVPRGLRTCSLFVHEPEPEKKKKETILLKSRSKI